MIHATLIDQLYQAAEQSEPYEMCGLLFGETFVRTLNVSTEPITSFEIAPEDYMKACMVHDGKPWALVHSHPKGEAVLSVKDCRLMDALEKTNHDLVMIVVSRPHRTIRAFKKAAHVYERIWESIG